MQAAAINHAVYPVAGDCFRAFEIPVAEQRYGGCVDADDAVDHIRSGVGLTEYDTAAHEIACSRWAHAHAAPAAEEGEHALAPDAQGDGLPLPEQFAGESENGSVIG